MFTKGQYKGTPIRNAIITDPNYILWCIQNWKNFTITKEDAMFMKARIAHGDVQKFCNQILK